MRSRPVAETLESILTSNCDEDDSRNAQGFPLVLIKTTYKAFFSLEAQHLINICGGFGGISI